IKLDLDLPAPADRASVANSLRDTVRNVHAAGDPQQVIHARSQRHAEVGLQRFGVQVEVVPTDKLNHRGIAPDASVERWPTWPHCAPSLSRESFSIPWVL